jgi:hypothetical protein
MELYGRSVYQIELEVAIALYVRGSDAATAWEEARRFMRQLERIEMPY